MDEATLFDQVRSTVAEAFMISGDMLTMESSSDTVPEWDSLKIIHIAINLEKQFGVKFNEDDIITMTQISNITAAVKRRLAG